MNQQLARERRSGRSEQIVIDRSYAVEGFGEAGYPLGVSPKYPLSRPTGRRSRQVGREETILGGLAALQTSQLKRDRVTPAIDTAWRPKSRYNIGEIKDVLRQTIAEAV